MKCVCGYEYETKWRPVQKYNKVIKGDEKFIEILGDFTRYSPYWNHPNVDDVRVYACPKCGTLKIII